MKSYVRAALAAVIFATSMGGLAATADAAIECHKVYRRPACASMNGVPNIHCESARQRSATLVCKQTRPRGLDHPRRAIRIRRRR
jgi:hypothetical protein